MIKNKRSPIIDNLEINLKAKQSTDFKYPAVLLLTELYPPAIGGSPVLFEGVYTRLEGLKVVVLTDEITSPPLLGQTKTFGLEIIHAPIRTRRWGILDIRALVHHFSIAFRLWRLARQQPLIVHCGRALPEGLAALICRIMLGIPFIAWTHGEDIASALTSRELTFLMKGICRYASAVLANSMNTRRMLKQIGVPDEKIFTVYPGVDSERFHPGIDGSSIRHRYARPDDVLLLTVGRHQRRKGHDHAIEAVAKLYAEMPNIRYLIAGDGDERQRLESLVAEHGLGDCVKFVGEISTEELPAYYAACDIFLHPNRIDQGDVEGFGIVFLEAAASGKPVIGGRSGGVPEAVEEGVTGLLVSGTDVPELSDVLRQLVVSPDLRSALGAAGRVRVMNRYTWQAAVKIVNAVHAQVAQRSSYLS